MTHRVKRYGALLGLGLCFLIGQRAAMAQGVSSTPSLDWLTHLIAQQGLWVALIAVFFGGLALNLTPCVYPMIPVTLAFFTSQSKGALGRTTLLACCYVVGIAVNYAILGVVAAKTGALFGSWLQQPAVLIGITLIIVALSLSMFGFYDIRLPNAVTARVGKASAGCWGAFVMGLIVGVIAAPCIGPIVLGLLLLVSQLANPLEGFVLFFVLGLGMGVPYVFLGLLAHRVTKLPKAGAWLVWSKKGLGFILWGLALYFLKPLLSHRLLEWSVVGLLAGAGVYLGWLEPTRMRGSTFKWIRYAVGGGLVAAAVIAAWPHPAAGPRVTWIPYSDAALAQAKQHRQPVIIDSYADWCPGCVELDRITFRHPTVVHALSTVTCLRIDATQNISDEAQRLFERHHIYGLPTVLFFDQTGNERVELRVTGFVPPEEFLEHLKRIQTP